MDEKIPELTLTPDLTTTPELKLETQEADKPVPEAGPDLSNLTPAEQQAVLEFAEKIDLTNSGMVLQYGAAAQKNIASFSESTLGAVRTKDMGELGEMRYSRLWQSLRAFPLRKRRKRDCSACSKRRPITFRIMKTKYDKAEANVDKIAEQPGESSGDAAEGRGHAGPDVRE